MKTEKPNLTDHSKIALLDSICSTVQKDYMTEIAAVLVTMSARGKRACYGKLQTARRGHATIFFELHSLLRSDLLIEDVPTKYVWQQKIVALETTIKESLDFLEYRIYEMYGEEEDYE